MTGHIVCAKCGGCQVPVVTYGCLELPQCECAEEE